MLAAVTSIAKHLGVRNTLPFCVMFYLYRQGLFDVSAAGQWIYTEQHYNNKVGSVDGGGRVLYSYYAACIFELVVFI